MPDVPVQPVPDDDLSAVLLQAHPAREIGVDHHHVPDDRAGKHLKDPAKPLDAEGNHSPGESPAIQRSYEQHSNHHTGVDAHQDPIPPLGDIGWSRPLLRQIGVQL